MNRKPRSNGNRRDFLRLAGAAAAGVATAGLPLATFAKRVAGQDRLKIGVIGAGKIGSTLAAHWAKAGHEVMVSSRNLDEMKALAARLGPRARAGTPREAAAFGEVIAVTVPYGALPQVGRDYAAELRGKVVLDACNPFPGRDGAMAEEARAKGAGIASAGYLPGVQLVRAFNTIPHLVLRDQAHRAGDKVAVPLGGDDAAALDVAARLVRDAGFEPVIAGSLAGSKAFDPGSPVFGRGLTASELKQALGIN